MINRNLNKKRYFEDVLLCDKMRFEAQEAYKLLRTNVLFTLPDKKCKKIGVTSANRGEGKSTLSINLAYTLSKTRNKVLLVDLDLRLPSINKKMNVSVKTGLVDCLAGKVEFDEVVHRNAYNSLDIIYAGSIPANPAELIGSDRMKNFITGLENKYDYIIFDLPPVNIVSDALVAKDIIDGYVVVVRENYSNKRSLVDCLRQLDFLDANILGLVLVDAGHSSSSSYGKRKHYGKYYNKYGYGYYRHKNSDNTIKEV